MNPNFNCAEFDIIKSQAGLNRFRLSAKEWTEKTNAIGIISKTGRYGGTYAHEKHRGSGTIPYIHNTFLRVNKIISKIRFYDMSKYIL